MKVNQLINELQKLEQDKEIEYKSQINGIAINKIINKIEKVPKINSNLNIEYFYRIS